MKKLKTELLVKKSTKILQVGRPEESYNGGF